MASHISGALRESGDSVTSADELLRLVRVTILITRFEFRRGQDPWSAAREYECVPAPAFGETGMSRDHVHGQGPVFQTEWCEYHNIDAAINLKPTG